MATFESEDRFELKSLPEAYVILRRMSYGQKLERQGRASKMQILMQRGSKDVKGEIDTMVLASTLYDFKTCVVSHNLEKNLNGAVVLLDFSSPGDVAVLHPRVGEEIATLIDKMNNFEDEVDTPN
jgi:hypothetical protein